MARPSNAAASPGLSLIARIVANCRVKPRLAAKYLCSEAVSFGILRRQSNGVVDILDRGIEIPSFFVCVAPVKKCFCEFRLDAQGLAKVSDCHFNRRGVCIQEKAAASAQGLRIIWMQLNRFRETSEGGGAITASRGRQSSLKQAVNVLFCVCDVVGTVRKKKTTSILDGVCLWKQNCRLATRLSLTFFAAAHFAAPPLGLDTLPIGWPGASD